MIGLMAGLCYVGAVNNDQAGVQAIQGVLFILITENTFPAMYSALALIPKELPMLVRELRDGDYHPSALYLAKVLSYVSVCIFFLSNILYFTNFFLVSQSVSIFIIKPKEENLKTKHISSKKRRKIINIKYQKHFNFYKKKK